MAQAVEVEEQQQEQEPTRSTCVCETYARATERAALAGARWLGRGDQNGAEEAAFSGMRHAIELMRAEIQRDMMMLGIRALDELGPHSVRRANGTGIAPS